MNHVTGKGLSTSQINELLGKKHKRNFYGPALATFLKSDEVGINPREVWPKQLPEDVAVATIAQGFRNACKAAKIDWSGEEAVVTITTVGDQCFILHNERARVWQSLEDSGFNAAEAAALEVTEDEATEDDEELPMPTDEESEELAVSEATLLNDENAEQLAELAA